VVSRRHIVRRDGQQVAFVFAVAGLVVFVVGSSGLRGERVGWGFVRGDAVE
jgi:hypothetical protein